MFKRKHKNYEWPIYNREVLETSMLPYCRLNHGPTSIAEIDVVCRAYENWLLENDYQVCLKSTLDELQQEVANSREAVELLKALYQDLRPGFGTQITDQTDIHNYPVYDHFVRVENNNLSVELFERLYHYIHRQND